ncbi:uncharacterized protein J7T54_007461 [Emericellopsis cladophorae]|uniref:2EXR domain-containing protein n=1 Tax=Emericellopsis cladophorae TaxID=2686198 RepID=A0A9P9XWA8_9HYPO|nr:uncharacterized protein J7T54_007461 [Emericellopsis cladophorae]KAI6778808.1 hypothetical protein J7T54_007461 [Emericellopsis cladophorae]
MSSLSVQDDSPGPVCALAFRTFDDGHQPHSPRRYASLSRSVSTGRSPSPTTTTVSGSRVDDVASTGDFPQFTKLPPELRLKVWECLIQPRIVGVCCLQNDTRGGYQPGEKIAARRKELDARTTRGNQVPAILHVNSESRALGLKHYELTFGWRIKGSRPNSAPPRTYFNFAQDALFLTGDLEAYDSFGFNAPMVYYLRKEDTARVKHVACPFRELGYPHQHSDLIWGCLWHIVDRFKAATRLLLTVGEGDEERLGRAGHAGPDLVTGTATPGLTMAENESMAGQMQTQHALQNIWRAWLGGRTATNSTMADKQMLLVSEAELMNFVTRQAQ